MDVKTVARFQLEAIYKMAFLAYVRNDPFGIMPQYVQDMGVALYNLGVDVDDIQLELLEAVNNA